MKNQTNKGRTIGNFLLEIGYVKLQPNRQLSICRKNQKFQAKYFGPYQLKSASASILSSTSLPSISHIKDAYSQAIPDRRMMQRHNAAATQILVHWKGLSPADASREYADEMRARFPSFFLEDKES
ncbi:hypothetical protein GH714_028685 [Hevea brasiliensis]|uniref:Chromo domain-containing protein n=1 Tax=Hevea brasiliensis TaxID=3981 RepID=A0A6A6LBS2_HEVBR|nr:hypothetical protein GH714_028685 [Hevea brasiliensis]